MPIIDAFSQLDKQLDNLAVDAESSFDKESAELFMAHRMICEELQDHVLELIAREQLNAVNAIEKCFDYYSSCFSEISDSYLGGRADDFSELKYLLLDLINHNHSYLHCRDYRGCEIGECVLGNEHILVSNKLTANTAIRIKKHTRGIITDKAGVNSHATVIARSLDIPVISGIKEPLESFSCEDDILMDGESGEIIINPTAETLEKYRAHLNRPHEAVKVVEPLPQFRVLADIDRCQDVEQAIHFRADGIGMFRTEFEMLAKGHVLSLDEQVESYHCVLERMKGKPVYFRLFDLGSDKSAPWLGVEDEDNPALGCRGARFLLSHPDILEIQARAIAEASRLGPVNVIYPMISGIAEYRDLKNMFMQATKEIKGSNVRHGIMFEVPSACISARELYEVIEFGRIGTNDLVQYLFACDRTSDCCDYADLAGNTALWDVISLVADAARRAGKPLELCGSVADTARFVPEMMKLGITTVSTRPENIAALRMAAAGVEPDITATP